MNVHRSNRIEIEAKYKVAGHATLRERLHALGAVCDGKVIEVNRIFDDRERSLLAGQRGLRLRVNQDADGGFHSATLTYKGPPHAHQVKQREEIETQVGDPDAMLAILRALGFVEVLCFEKRRESWTLEGARIELDELPYLGCFIEIEADSHEAIETLRQRLGIDASTLVPETYVALLAEHARRTGADPLMLRFV